MNIRHLTDDELDELLLGADAPAGVSEHLASCVVCRRRRDTFLAAVGEARGADADAATRARVRQRALAAWGVAAPRHWVRWLGAAAALVVLGLLPLLRSELAPQPKINADRVLVEVDKILARDPLDEFAARDVVEAVVPAGQEGAERSTS